MSSVEVVDGMSRRYKRDIGRRVYCGVCSLAMQALWKGNIMRPQTQATVSTYIGHVVGHNCHPEKGVIACVLRNRGAQFARGRRLLHKRVQADIAR